MIHVTFPVGIELQDWADQVSYDLAEYTVVQKLLDVEKWQDWAVLFVTSPGISQYNIPNPYDFDADDWKGWGMRLCNALPT